MMRHLLESLAKLGPAYWYKCSECSHQLDPDVTVWRWVPAQDPELGEGARDPKPFCSDACADNYQWKARP